MRRGGARGTAAHAPLAARRRAAIGAAAFVVLSLFGPAPGSPVAQEGAAPCPPEASSYFPDWPAPGRRLPLRSLTFLRDNIFAPDDPRADLPYARLANALHVRTRESILRNTLLFEEGDSVGVLELETAVRRLRAQPFLSGEVDMEIAGGADSLDLVIRTRDIWSTRPEVTLRRSGELLEWSFAARETNLFGLGKQVLLEAGREETEHFWGCGYSDPQLFGSRAWLILRAAFGSDLRLQEASLLRPFESPSATWGYAGQARRYEGPVIDHRRGLNGPEWDAEQTIVSGWAGERAGGGARSAVRLLPFVHLQRERYEPPADSAFVAADAMDGPPGGRPLAERDIRAAGFAVEILHERYEQMACIDALGPWEDVDLGASLRTGLGYSSRSWGAARNTVFFTVLGRQAVGLGSRRFLVANVEALGQVRAGRVEDALSIVRLRFYDRLGERNTLAAGLRGSFGIDLAPQDLPTLGADNGLRGFEAYRFWGERAVLANVEDRILLARDLFGLVSVGAAGFVDAGALWNAGKSRRARPKVSAGAGLRLHSCRAGGALVTRLDLAYPLLGAADGDDWVFSFSAGQAF